MANNRVWLKCRCGGTYFLAKHMLQGWYTYPGRGMNMTQVPMGEDFMKWVDDHGDCFWPDDGEMGKGWDHQFSLEYED